MNNIQFRRWRLPIAPFRASSLTFCLIKLAHLLEPEVTSALANQYQLQMSRRRSGAVKQLKQLTSSGRGDVDLEKLAAKACKAMLSPRPADLETSSDSEEEEESSTTNLPEVLMLESEAKSKTPKYDFRRN